MKAKVYLITASSDESERTISQKAHRLFKAAGLGQCFHKDDFTAVKIHVGEHRNTTYIKASCIKGLVEELLSLKTKPFLTDTSTLYTGRRHNAVDHAILASEHGFSVDGLGIPFIPPDGLFGTAETPVQINGVLNKEVLIADDIVRCQSILSVAHVTGHIAACFGATLKTLGMGCASRKGKMRQHAALKPEVKKSKCSRCGECFRHCPAGAVTLDDIQAHIDSDKCIGCAECVAVCRFDAVKYDWGAENKTLQQNIAEHAAGVLADKKGRAAFFNFLISITADCDCFGTPKMPPIVEDIGIAASTDPVALDMASLDMVESAGQSRMAALVKNEKLNPIWQIEHAERLGLGTTSYEIVEIK